MESAVYGVGIAALIILAFFTFYALKPKLAAAEAKVESVTSEALLRVAAVAINDAIKLRNANLAEATKLTAQAGVDTSRIQQTASAIVALTTATPTA